MADLSVRPAAKRLTIPEQVRLVELATLRDEAGKPRWTYAAIALELGVSEATVSRTVRRWPDTVQEARARLRRKAGRLMEAAIAEALGPRGTFNQKVELLERAAAIDGRPGEGPGNRGNQVVVHVGEIAGYEP